MRHYYYEDLMIDEDSIENSDLVDQYIASPGNSRVFPGDYSWAGLFLKLSMLGFTCSYQNAKLKINQLFCYEDDYERLNKLVLSFKKA